MIRIERPEMPERLIEPLAAGRAAAAEFFASKAGMSGHQRFDFSRYLHDALDALLEVFHGKCAFCESRIQSFQDPEVVHFRPSQNCVDQKGQHYSRHYSWLGTDWANLYPACDRCLAAKRNRFPIQGERAPFGASAEQLAEERPLLLDPCGDNPEEHLVYADDARVSSASERGRVTIELFDLNRASLVGLRRSRLKSLRAILETVEALERLDSPGRGKEIDSLLLERVEKQLDDFIRDQDEFAGMCRQFVRRALDPEPVDDETPMRSLGVEQAEEGFLSMDEWETASGEDEYSDEASQGIKRGFSLPIDDSETGSDDDSARSNTRKSVPSPDVDDLFVSFSPTRGSSGGRRSARRRRGTSDLPLGDLESWTSKLRDSDLLQSTRYVSKTAQVATSTAFDEYEEDRESFSLEDERMGEEAYYLQSRTIERIELINFRALGHLKLELPRRGGAWTMLLGENGCGKSSVLQAVALTLMGETYRRQLGLDARKFVRRGERDGSVKIKLSGLRRELVLRFDQSSQDFDGQDAAKVLLLAYGATRLLPREPMTSTGTPYARVDNLFNPFVPLEDARRWLLKLDPATFEQLKPSLKELLNLGQDDDLKQNAAKNRIDVTLFDSTVPLEQLSDGYQTVIALVAEIMSVLLDRWQDMAAAEGIVLVDEIGAHLHPKWKMQIVRSLRSAFPAVQFLATTHDPLCLRGLEDDEVVVMRRNSRHAVVQVRDLPPVKALRVDQLLTSEHFGLSSVHDPESAELFEEYYGLLAKAGPTSDSSRLQELRDRLEGRSLMGQTRRERLMLEAIDQHLATEAEALGHRDSIGRKQALDLKLQRILKSADSDAE